VRLSATGLTPNFVLRDGCAYHIFLSHVWATGQDQVRHCSNPHNPTLTSQWYPSSHPPRAPTLTL
jgi:hypothetical protein